MNPYAVIIRPIVTEKATYLRDKQTKYLFEIRAGATKLDVKNALKAIWNVDVEKVGTLNQRGKVKRRGRFMSTPKTSKRAFVTLKGDARLPLFEEQ